jgi:uncharacterized membrane protein
MRARRIGRWVHRIGIALAALLALLGLLNLFNRHPDAAPNAVELFALAAATYVIALVLSWVASYLLRHESDEISN